MTIKSIEQLTLKEAVDATYRQGSHELRRRVYKLAKKKLGDGKEFLKLEALLNRSRRATEKRNDLLHKVFAYDAKGNPVIRDDEHSWNPIPTVEELEPLANELAAIAGELEEARYDGFLKEALARVDPPQAQT